MTLDNSDAAVAAMEANVAKYDADIKHMQKCADDAEDDRIRAQFLSVKVQAQGKRDAVLESLKETYANREKSGSSSDDPTQVAAKARDFLVSLGWACTPPGENALPRVIAALETFPEAREAVLRVLGAGVGGGG